MSLHEHHEAEPKILLMPTLGGTDERGQFVLLGYQWPNGCAQGLVAMPNSILISM